VKKGVDFSMVHIDLAHKPGWYRSVNPSGLVPAATYQGSSITESIDICRYGRPRGCTTSRNSNR
jgi:glutathione S-transferase